MTTDTATGSLAELEQLAAARQKILTELRKAIVGQDQVIDELLIALFSNGHCVLVGVPGLAKTLLISTLAKSLELRFNRIQFTPDLMPSDITGTEIIEEDKTSGKRVFKFIQGPIFANVVLADEINRTPPKTQAALLQAMQEREVTTGGQTYSLKPPFFVLATQNPIELEGTYPLPEAQLDRFMFMVHVDYPNQEDEVKIVAATTSAYESNVQSIMSGDDIIRFQKLIRKIPVSDYVIDYAVRLARATRPGRSDSPDIEAVSRYVSWGAGPRASQYLVLGAKTLAALKGNLTPSVDDVKRIARPVLRHRILTNFNAEAEGIKTETIIDRLLETIPEGHRK
ncbi:MAG: MoxR-like ATPase [bacterium]|nr:MAG: MoxR-like ATPase [bacterium]